MIAVVIDWPDSTDLDTLQVLSLIDEVESLLVAEPLVRHPFSIRNVLRTLGTRDDNF